MIAPGMKFRWRYYDSAVGDTVTGWHLNRSDCWYCCCGYPRAGIHVEPVGYYDDDGIFTSTHTRLNVNTMEIE